MDAHIAMQSANRANGLAATLDSVHDSIRNAANDGRYSCKVVCHKDVAKQIAKTLRQARFEVQYLDAAGTALFIRWE